MNRLFKGIASFGLLFVLMLTFVGCGQSNVDKVQDANVTTIFIIDGKSYDVLAETFIDDLQNSGWSIESNNFNVEAYKETKTFDGKKQKVSRTSIHIELQETKTPDLTKIKSVSFDSKNFKPSNLRYKDIPMNASPDLIIMTLGEHYTQETDTQGLVTFMAYDAKTKRVDMTFENGYLAKIVVSKK